MGQSKQGSTSYGIPLNKEQRLHLLINSYQAPQIPLKITNHHHTLIIQRNDLSLAQIKALQNNLLNQLIDKLCFHDFNTTNRYWNEKQLLAAVNSPITRGRKLIKEQLTINYRQMLKWGISDGQSKIDSDLALIKKRINTQLTNSRPVHRPEKYF